MAIFIWSYHLHKKQNLFDSNVREKKYIHATLICWVRRTNNTQHKKRSFPLRISSVNVTKSAEKPADLVTFTEDIVNGKLYFFVQWLRHIIRSFIHSVVLFSAAKCYNQFTTGFPYQSDPPKKIQWSSF